MTWTSWITFAIAVIGAALGIFNTWQGWRDRAVRLRVIPKYSDLLDEHMRRVGMPCISVEVQNLGTYAVSVEEVGFLIGTPKGNLPKRAPFRSQNVIAGPSLPHRLERHDAITVTVPIAHLPQAAFTGAYARTAAGQLTKGTSAAFKDVMGIIRSGR